MARRRRRKSQNDGARAVRQLMEENRMLRNAFAMKWDSAQTHSANAAHWAKADSLSPNMSSSPQTRAILRRRSRYEIIENNSWLKGTVMTVCDDFAGTGARVHITDDRLTVDECKLIEKRWGEWCAAVKLRQKLWRACIGKIVDGETFGLLAINEKLNHPVQLDIQLFEPECIASPMLGENERVFDGIRLDDFGNPESYFLLNQHPGGDPIASFNALERDGRWIPAESMLHWFRQDRGWLRGVPELATSLPACAVLRRYTMAELRKQEVNADYTVFFETQTPAFGGPVGGKNFSPEFQEFPLQTGMAVALPHGMSAKSLGTTPPGQEMDSFVGSILREIARPLGVTFNIVVGTSKDSNMASSVVDVHLYKSAQESRRLSCEEDWLNPLFNAWFQLGAVTPGYFGDSLKTWDILKDGMPLSFKFYWAQVGLQHTDPKKVADAMISLHQAGFLLDEDIQQNFYNRDYDVWFPKWEEEVKRRAEVQAEVMPAVETEETGAENPENGDGEDETGDE